MPTLRTVLKSHNKTGSKLCLFLALLQLQSCAKPQVYMATVYYHCVVTLDTKLKECINVFRMAYKFHSKKGLSTLFLVNKLYIKKPTIVSYD